MGVPAMQVLQVARTPPASAGITYLGGDAEYIASPTATAITLTLPSFATNDFAIIFYFSDDSTATDTYSDITTPSGWTQSFTPVSDTGGRDRKIYAWHRKLVGGDSNPSLAVSNATYRNRAATLAVFRGVDTTTPFDATPTTSFGQNNATPNAQAITTVTDNACVAIFMGVGSSTITTWAGGAPSGYTLGEWASGNFASAAAAYLLNAGTAGVKSPGSWTPTGADGTDEHADCTFALRAA